MKKLKTFLLAGCAISLLAGCENAEQTNLVDPNGVKEVKILNYPKQTFYYGEDFNNVGLKVGIVLNSGAVIESEDVTTPKISTLKAGTNTVKVYYTNEQYNVDEILTYEIEVIEWTKEEKYIFQETSLSYYNGIYYPKMKGMEMVVETDDDDGSIVDYWIEKKNATFADVETYLELLNEYNVVKKVRDSSGTYELTYKFYEQSVVPSDFTDLYDINDPICYKLSCYYEYLDQYSGTILNLYGNQIEDTLVIGMNDEGSMIVRYIADSVLFESLLSCEVNEYCDLNGLYNGTLIEYLNQALIGYDETNEQGVSQHYIGYIEELAPLAVDYFILPNYEPDVVALANYASAYPWLHGGDALAFEIELAADDKEEYDNFIAKLDACSDFVKTTKTEKIKGEDTNVTVYTIEDKDYVGHVQIAVSDYIEDGSTYYTTQGSTKAKVTTDCYRIYYIFQEPDMLSPCEELCINILKDFYNAESAVRDVDYEVYVKGQVGATVFYPQYNSAKTTDPKTDDQVENKEEAYQKFVEKYLNGYTVTKEPTVKEIQGTEVYTAEFANDNYTVSLYAYFYGNGKFAVEFMFGIK